MKNQTASNKPPLARNLKEIPNTQTLLNNFISENPR